MHAVVAASFAARVQDCPTWLKSAARATFVLCVIKGTVWLAGSWLALRGLSGL